MLNKKIIGGFISVLLAGTAQAVDLKNSCDISGAPKGEVYMTFNVAITGAGKVGHVSCDGNLNQTCFDVANKHIRGLAKKGADPIRFRAGAGAGHSGAVLIEKHLCKNGKPLSYPSKKHLVCTHMKIAGKNTESDYSPWGGGFDIGDEKYVGPEQQRAFSYQGIIEDITENKKDGCERLERAQQHKQHGNEHPPEEVIL